VLRGRFAEMGSERGVVRVLLSLSSDDGVAVAVAMVSRARHQLRKE
jgi:hypothetical protein